jgi:flagellar basal-body rod protein FlgF
MINGLYTAASGMNAELTRQETIANNLANATTTGYKKDVATFQAFPAMLVSRINDRMDKGAPQVSPFVRPMAPPVGIVGHGAQVSEVTTDLSDGNYISTEGKFDMAVQGNAMFTIQREDGSRAYTRAGSFSLDGEGKLVTKAGDVVLSRRNAPIKIKTDAIDVVFDQGGRVVVDGVEGDSLLMTSFEKENDLVKQGESLFVSLDGKGLSTEAKDYKSRLLQGYLENPNVSVIREMVDMISVMRAYEANQKVITMQDETLGKVINEVGRV